MGKKGLLSILCDDVTTKVWQHCLKYGMSVHTEFENMSNLLTIAATTGNKQLIKTLKRYKFCFSKFLMKEYQRNSETTQSPFMILCKHGFIDIFEMIDINSSLMSSMYKANPNLYDLDGNSPLHLASLCKNATEMIEYLTKNVYVDSNEVDDHNKLNNKYVCISVCIWSCCSLNN